MVIIEPMSSPSKVLIQKLEHRTMQYSVPDYQSTLDHENNSIEGQQKGGSQSCKGIWRCSQAVINVAGE
jgi:hypothetical protein